MKLNYETCLVGKNVILVPYRKSVRGADDNNISPCIDLDYPIHIIKTDDADFYSLPIVLAQHAFAVTITLTSQVPNMSPGIMNG